MNRPLALPAGSTRALLALILIGTTAAMALLGLEIPGELWSLDGVVAALYFEHRRNG